MELLALPLGLAIGLAVGALGGGGSVLAVPVLVYLLDQPVADATTASLLVVSLGALTGMVGHARAGRVCWRHAGLFTLSAVPGLALGTLLGDLVAGEWLLAGFAVVMLLAARSTWRRADEEPEPDGPWERTGACPPLRLPRDAFAGALVGLVTGFFGVGGGFLVVPTLAVGLAFTLRTAVGTSLAIIAATSALGLLTHLVAGRGFETGPVLVLAAACVAGAVGGAWVSRRIPQAALGHAFAVLIVAVAGYLLASVTLLGGPPGSG